MRVSNFSVQIPEARERDSGHAEIPHGTQYTLRIGNYSSRRCDAEVVVDGKPVGGFRIDAYETITLERPAHDTGRFTFYRAGTSEASAAGEGKITTDDRGLIQVTFKPERYYERPTPTVMPRIGHLSAFPQHKQKTSGGTTETSANEPREFTCNSPGVTGLSGQSQQSFYNVSPLSYDLNDVVTISVRLVAAEVGPRELTPANRQGNPVPSPLP